MAIDKKIELITFLISGLQYSWKYNLGLPLKNISNVVVN